MRKTKPIRAGIGSALWIFGAFLAIWFLIMVSLTWITAHILNERMSMENRDMIQNLIYTTRVYDWATWDHDVEQDTKDFWLFDGLRSFGRRNNRVSGGLLRDVQHPAQTACVVYDGDGNLLEKNGNGLYFWYMTEENWFSAESDTYEDGVARVLYDQSEISEMAIEVIQKTDLAALRLTGVMDNGYLIPSKIEYITTRDFYDALFRDGRTGSYERHKFIQEMVDSGTVEWQTFLASSFEDENEQVYYSIRCYASMYDAGDPITVDGTEYANLMNYVEQLDKDLDPGTFWVNDSGDLWDRLICRENEVYRDNDYELGLEYRILAAARFSPMKLAIDGLLYVYMGSLFLVLLSALVIWRVLKKRLIIPVRAINEAVGKGWKIPLYGSYYTSHWQEEEELDQQYSRTRREMERLQDENNRLNMALNYAKEAENNRRQMTSAIAHELKTPLAVIRSYAEGLKEHIAEEKQDHYLDVIQSETEFLDEMVLEMLDLSRLEAGKVKLSRDECHVSDMAAAVFDKLQLAAEEKNLTVTCSFAVSNSITADEGRLTQVITNLAANAIQHSPDGGKIIAKTYEDRNYIWFRVENESHRFSEEELEKVWETFYRTDKARSGKGTGLGLAISKNIIELHGGVCGAENIQNGVAFWFRLRK